MSARAHLDWPFFDADHRALAASIEAWAAAHAEGPEPEDVDAATQGLVRALGEGGWLRHVVTTAYGGARDRLDARTLCLIREALAQRSALADFAFAMQGLGSAPLTLFGSDALRARHLPRVAGGRAIAAFAISERQAGSDVAAIATRAVRDGADYVLDGEKTWISNAGIADFYVVLARSGEAEGARGLSALLVESDAPGLSVRERIEVISPHPLGTITLHGCRVPAANLLGAPGHGFKVAMATLDVFRATVGAAALGMARRALAEAVAWARERVVFGRPLGEHQMTQARVAEMACDVDASALLVYRAAWRRDASGGRVTRDSAMAKLYATEAAQRVIDSAVQLFGGLGVVAGHPVERLYRDIRPLRIYEGTSEIQRLVVARETLSEGGDS
ncbi:MAG: acyl-CoA dehydrogenase family protein [Candidatus Krumholzibacteria bacterium]|nr:acyl-CoA dehydrogenase family protein [Candidatus Krumholzibacteria bacterium]